MSNYVNTSSTVIITDVLNMTINNELSQALCHKTTHICPRIQFVSRLYKYTHKCFGTKSSELVGQIQPLMQTVRQGLKALVLAIIQILEQLPVHVVHWGLWQGLFCS